MTSRDRRETLSANHTARVTVIASPSGLPTFPGLEPLPAARVRNEEGPCRAHGLGHVAWVVWQRSTSGKGPPKGGWATAAAR